ncbi:MAG TPA: GrpB family protein [Opitutaceae bacterium]
MNIKIPPTLSEHESLQRAIHEPLQLVPYDTAWPLLFEAERARLRGLCPTAFLGIEHVGSTAVPTLSAKPIIDLMAGVPSLAEADAILPGLCANGYVTSAEFNATLVDKRWLMRHAEGRRTHHLHLMVFESLAWRKHLAFREALRASAHLRSRYEALKTRLVAQAGSDREAYTAMKTAFVNDVVAGCRVQ